MAAISTAIVVGGGIGGMTLACGLARAGVHTRVVERAGRSERSGTGICLLGNTLRALDTLGLAEACVATGYGFDDITTYDAAGNKLHRATSPRAFRSDVPSTVGILRTRLADILEGAAARAGATIDYGIAATDVEQDEAGVTLTLSDGTTQSADLLIAADGAYSGTRTRVFGTKHRPDYVGQGCWRYTVPRPSTMTGLEFYRTAGSALGGIPLSEDMCYYFLLENSPTPVRMAEDELGDLLRERLAAFSAPAVRAAVALIDGPRDISYRPFDTLLMPQPWHRGRVALLGDAAHSLTPQLTSGGGMAIEDAVVLIEMLIGCTTLGDALSGYGIRRGSRVGTVFRNSLQICRWEQDPAADRDETMALLMQSYRFLGQAC